jgi:phosphatidylglycerol---prolipoprotein diacylglyceryl transferase
MIPNIQIPPLRIYGPIATTSFGLLVAIALIVGFKLSKQRAKVLNLDMNAFESSMIWAVVSGFILAHITSAFLYYPAETLNHPLSLIDFRNGISSFGGFIGGFAAMSIYLRRKNLSFFKYADAVMFGMVPAWIIGRMGCTIAFDHPGLKTSFFLGMADGLGVIRHNLGFYEMLFTAVLAVILYALKKFHPFEGFHTALMLLLYSPARFMMDFLRIADKKYSGFTPGQYFSVAMFITACLIFFFGFKSQKTTNQ